MKKVIEQLKELGYQIILYSNYNAMITTDNIQDTETLYFGFNKIGDGPDDFIYIGKGIKIPKREKNQTVEYFLNKINADSIYTQFTPKFEKFLNDSGIKASCYATSYGIGIFIILGVSGGFNATKAIIDKVLNDNGIEFKNEYSEARWVFRYVISKSKVNIERLNSFQTKLS